MSGYYVSDGEHPFGDRGTVDITAVLSSSYPFSATLAPSPDEAPRLPLILRDCLEMLEMFNEHIKVGFPSKEGTYIFLGVSNIKLSNIGSTITLKSRAALHITQGEAWVKGGAIGHIAVESITETTPLLDEIAAMSGVHAIAESGYTTAIIQLPVIWEV